MATLQDTQEKILSIMIRHKSVVNDVIENGITEHHFDLKYRPLFCGIVDANISGAGLTEQSFQIFIQKNFKNGSYAKWTANKDSQENMAVIGERNQFFKVVNSGDGTSDDIHALVSLLKDEVLKREATEAISKFSDQSKGNFRAAAQNLSERLGNILDEQTSTIDFIRLSDYSEEFMKDLARRKSHPEECLYTGIKEIDATMQVGLRPGTLTLFAADVGGFKTTMMLNIAINIYKNTDETVLFIPLEMPYDMLVRKIVAREANVPLAEIEKANLLKPEQENRIAQEIDKFRNEASRFVILDPRERTTVASIARAIEKRKAICKPRVVVLDYISILSPEPSYAKLQPHEWYGQMCKDLRALGKKHGFAVISAVQLGRDAIKRLRTQKEGQQSVGSEDLRGSHDYSADADNIYAQVRHPTQPSEKLQLFCIKARYGSTTFGKSSVAILDIKPDIGRITSSTDQLWNAASGDAELDAMTKIAVPPPGDDLDIDTPIQSSSPQISTFNPPNNDSPKPKKIPKNDFDD